MNFKLLLLLITAALIPLIYSELLPDTPPLLEDSESLIPTPSPPSPADLLYNYAISILEEISPAPLTTEKQSSLKRVSETDNDDNDFFRIIARSVVHFLVEKRIIASKKRIPSDSTTSLFSSETGKNEGNVKKNGVVDDLEERKKRIEDTFRDKNYEKIWSFKVGKDDSDDVKRSKAVRILEFVGYTLKNLEALETLGDMYLFSKYSHKLNVTTAFNHFSHAASTFSSPKSQRILGAMYATTIGTSRNYAKAILYTTFAALNGDAVAQQTLGYYNLKAISTPHNCADSAFYYMLAAESAVAEYKSGPVGGKTALSSVPKLADTIAGGVYGSASGSGHNKESTQGAATTQDYLELTKIDADKGDVISAFHVGQFYYYGTTEIPKDYNIAFIYFLKAGKSALPVEKEGKSLDAEEKKVVSAIASSCGYIGRMYWRGEGVLKVDEVQAGVWFEKGAKLDNPMSLNGLAMMYLNGVAGYPKSAKVAAKYFYQAAKLEHPDAQVHLVELLLASENPDYQLITKYLTQAARYNHILALYHLGKIMIEGLDGQERCLQGVSHLKTLVEKGNWANPLINEAHAAFLAGDYDLSVIKYVFAAEQGFEIAQLNAAWLIDSGRYDTQKNRVFSGNPYEVALNLWNRASNQNSNVDARIKVGDYFFTGLGVENFVDSVPSDSTTASEDGTASSESNDDQQTKDQSSSAEITTPQKQITIASVLNTVFEKYLMSQHTSYSRKAQYKKSPDYEKAAVYYQVAAQTEYSALAMWNLGWMHENGIGVKKDFHLAKRLYDQSLTTNPDAYLAIYLSLCKLYIKSMVSYFIGGNQQDFIPIWGDFSSNGLKKKSKEDEKNKKDQVVDGDKFGDGEKEKANKMGSGEGSEYDSEEYWENVLNDQEQAIAELFETVVFAGLIGLAGVLLFWRGRVAGGIPAPQQPQQPVVAQRPAARPTPAQNQADPNSNENNDQGDSRREQDRNENNERANN